MNRIATLAALSFAFFFTSVVQGKVTFDWAIVGNRGNADDIHGYGGVDYTYRVSKHEVTNAQYTEFLNAVDPTGSNANLGGGDGFLYNANMSSDARGGINFNGNAANGAKYEIKSGRDNNPVVYVSFFDSMRFVNWLHNGQGASDTEMGVYTIGSGTNEVRSVDAKYWITSEDEWYKAAYYDPSGVYYRFPTGTDTEPYSDNPSSLNTPDDTNVANYFRNDFLANGYDAGFAVTGSAIYEDSQNYLTDVGAYPLAMSPYGTFDQAGNVWEWNEAVISPSLRGMRGGSRSDFAYHFRADNRYNYNPRLENNNAGFRVATVPEPSTISLCALAGLAVAAWRFRRPI